MKKISQAIIGATLILDVAVVFTFGLAVISSFEDGSRLPETTFVRKSSEGRVAGTMTTNAVNTTHIYLDSPAINGEVFTGLKILKAKTSSEVYSVKFTIKRISNGAIGDMTATRVPGTILDWNREIDTAQMPNETHSITAKAFSIDGTLLATSQIITVSILNNSTTFDNTTTTPSVTFNSPAAGTLNGIISISGSLSNFSTSYSIPIKELQVWQGATWKKNFPLTRDLNNSNNLIGSMDTTTLADSDYTIKIHLVYNDGASDKVLDSGPVSVTVNNANTTTSSGASTDTSSTSSTGTDSTTSTTDNTATDTTTPPPAGTTATTLTVDITNPALSAIPVILRARDNPLIAKTSAVASGLQFKIHKTGEPADWITPIKAESTNDIDWKAIMNLTDFKDGVYDITAVAKTGLEEILSKPILVAVQRFGLNWANPQSSQTPQILSGAVPIKVKINGIYEKDGITSVKGVKAYFYQTNTQAPYTEIYNEQLYQNSGTQEWRLYDWTLKREKSWNTKNSSNGKYRLIIKVINESISASNVWFPTEPIFIEINNQQAVSTSNNTNTSISNTNNNQNINAAATNTTATNTAASNASNAAAAQNTNTTNNTNADAAQNVNTVIDSAISAAQGDLDQDGLSDEDERTRGTDANSVDTDKDGLIDFEEIDKYKTDPLKNDTDGDGYLDGEEVQSLHDPRKSPTDPTAAVLVKSKPIEEPKASEKPILESLAVEKIENKEIKTTPPPSADNVNSQASTSETTENTIVLKGKGPANTILTLFIYSEDPIVVTVRTNENGEWIYELDKTLEDGEHEVYATITDDTGKIESTSSPMRFLVKQARAETIPERADTGIDSVPGSSSTNLYLLISGIMVFIAIVAGFIIALRRKRGDTNQIT